MEHPPLGTTPEKPQTPELVGEAYEDQLTGLPNRRWLDRHLQQVIEDYPGNFAVLYLDVDGLKERNDTYGHGEGDKLIQDTGRIIQDTLRKPEDTLSRVAARLGGDEFFGIVVDIDREEDLQAVIGRVQDELSMEGISISIGGLLHTTEDAVELISKADRLMYHQKQARRSEAQQRDDKTLLKELTDEQLEAMQKIDTLTRESNINPALIPRILEITGIFPKN